jgi:DNA-directed RNA polymerase specialized sigma24 family protein
MGNSMGAAERDLSDSEMADLLMTAAGKGDREALSALYERYAEELYESLVLAGSSGKQAEDRLYTAFANIWRNARRWKKGQDFIPYIYGLVHQMEPDAPRQPAPCDPDELAAALGRLRREDYSDSEAVEAALDTLPSQLRRLYVLQEFSRLNYAESAAAMGIERARAASGKTEAVFALCIALAKGADNRESTGAGAIGIDEARRIVLYADGEISAAESSEAEERLNANADLSAFYDGLSRLRRTVRGLKAPGLSGGLFERLDHDLLLKRRRRGGFWVRLSMELTALVLVSLAAAAAWLVSEPDRWDAARTWMFHKGILKTLPMISSFREGEPVVWLRAPEGAVVLAAEDGKREYRFPPDGSLRIGEKITLAPGRKAHLVFPDGSQCVARGSARLSLEGSNSAPRLHLYYGEMWCSILKSPSHIVTPNGTVKTVSSEFNLRIQTVSDLDAKQSGRPVRLSVSGQRIGESETEGPGALEGKPLATRVTVVAGMIEIGEKLAVTGETVVLREDVDSEQINTPFHDPVFNWAAEARLTAGFGAVSHFTSLLTRFNDARSMKNPELLEAAIKETDMQVLFKEFLDSEATEEQWYRSLLARQLTAVSTLRIASVQEMSGGIVLDVAPAQGPICRARLLFEEVEEEKEKRWKLVRTSGELVPFRQPGEDEESAPPPVDLGDEKPRGTSWV